MKKIFTFLVCINILICKAQDSKSCLMVATYLVDNGSDDLLCQSNGYLKEVVADEQQFKLAEKKAWDKAPGLITDVSFINSMSAVLIYQYELINGPGCKPTKIKFEKSTSLEECMKLYNSSVEWLLKENATNFKIIFQWEGKSKKRMTTLLQISDLDIEVSEYYNGNGLVTCKMSFKNNNKIKSARFYYQDEYGANQNIVIPPGSNGAMFGRFKNGNMFKASFEEFEEEEPFDLMQYLKEKVYKFATSDFFKAEEVIKKEKPTNKPAVTGVRG